MNEYAKTRVSMEEYLTYQNHEIGKPNNKGFALVDDHDSLFVNLDLPSWHAILAEVCLC